MKTKAIVHLKIDTGMERIGVHYYNAEKFLEAAYSYKNINVEGIYSHFATAESDDLTFTKLQLERFNEVLDYFNKKFNQATDQTYFKFGSCPSTTGSKS